MYGRNGSGKTSIINLLKESLHNQKNISFVDFEPFKYNNQSEITKSFYESIKLLINKDFFLPGVWRLSDKYYDLFTGVTSSPLLGFLNINKMFEFFRRKETFDNLQIVISKYLSDLNIKCVVVIDNIDRCSLKNRYLLFQLISTIGKTKNLFYLIAASEYEMLSAEDPQPVTIVD